MILHWLIEKVSGTRLDEFIEKRIYRPLGITDLFYLPPHRPRPQKAIAATERCPWRKRLLVGDVHDENAYVIGGVGGQSGLFGTAAAVYQLLKILMDQRGQRMLV